MMIEKTVVVETCNLLPNEKACFALQLQAGPEFSGVLRIVGVPRVPRVGRIGRAKAGSRDRLSNSVSV